MRITLFSSSFAVSTFGASTFAASAFALLLAAGGAAAPALAAEASSDTSGFLYGRITTRDGDTYEGRLRWSDEEAFWGDYFNSAKEENPWIAQAPRRDRERRRRTIEVFGVEVGSIHDWDGRWESRQFIARFGDIARIEPGRGDEVEVTLKSGAVFELEGGSNDVESEVRVWDKGLGVVDVDWDRIRAIELMATPALGTVPERLHGTVKTRTGDFTGFIQWDQQECLGPDELDGETRDGDVEVPMGNIRTIERRSSSSSRVVLRDGREVVLSDTNDVDDSNRGIYVEDTRYGRVLVNWDAFDRVDFHPAGSGPSYGDFPAGGPIEGTVTVAGGRKLSGRIVYDLDESETTEMLDGKRDDIEYSLPFSLVASVVPRGDSSLVTLRSGELIELDDTTDVSDDNGGLLVFTAGNERPTYVGWEDVERIDFDAPRASWPPVRR
jgi:hypothetical protein